MASEFITVEQCAKRCKVDVETVRRWCREQQVKAVLTPGGKGYWRIEVDERGWPVKA